MRLVYFCSLYSSEMPEKVRKYLCQYLLDEYQDKHLRPLGIDGSTIDPATIKQEQVGALHLQKLAYYHKLQTL
jgi:hypothetical protein